MSIETRLHELFDGQEHAIDVAPREWDGVPLAAVTPIDERRRPRARGVVTAGIAVVATAAAIAVAVSYGNSGARLRVHPSVAASPHRSGENPMTAIDEWNVEVDVYGKHLALANADMLRLNDAERASTDPASAAVIDATWHGQDGDTHVVIDLDHDANDWWVTQIRTSDGKGHSMTYDGTFMKTPLGKTSTGDLDLTDPQTGTRVHVTGLNVLLAYGAP